MGHALFYHLTRAPVEVTLPMLLTKALQADWRVVVRGTDAERMRRLDDRLWLGPEEGFLPHGLAGQPHAADQPVLLTTDTDSPNGAACVMSIDGAEVAADEVMAMERVCILFDGHDPQAVQQARGQWRRLTEAGCTAQYWSEASGRWTKQADSGGT